MVGMTLKSTTYTTATGDNLTSVSGSQKALADTEAAIQQLASDRANIGANEESLTYYSNQLSSLNNNLQAANSQIADVDVATESTNYAKDNILVQSGTAMLAQANSMPQSVLKLLS
jgi:flagellin